LHLAEDAPEEGSRLERGRHAEERRLLRDAAGRRLIETTVAPAYAHVGNHGRTAKPSERGRRHHLVDEPGMAETHPRLRRMDVDVHVRLRQGDREQHHREPVARQQRPIRVERRLQQRGIAYRPAVDDQDDLIAIAAGKIRRADQPTHAHAVLGPVNSQQTLGDVVTPQGADARARLGRRGRRQDGAPVVGHAQMRSGMRQRQLGQRAQARRQLRRRRLQELQARRRIEEEVPYLDAGAGVGRYFKVLLDRAAFAGQTQPVRGAARAARQHEARDGADRGQGLAAEPERGDGVEVFVAGELGSRVTLEGQRQFVGRHADPVVGHPDERGPAVTQVDGHRQRAGVERVLDQLLHRGGRALDNLSRGDLVDEVVRKPADPHRFRWSCHFASMFRASSGVRWPRSRLASSISTGSGAAGAKRPSCTASLASLRSWPASSSSARSAFERATTVAGRPASRATWMP
jgi:hypothetical protein